MTRRWLITTGPAAPPAARLREAAVRNLRTCLYGFPAFLGLVFLGLPLCGQEDQTGGSVNARIARVLAELDAAFGAGDAARFLTAFDPDHAGAHALLEQRMLRIFPPDRTDESPYRRKSTIIGTPRQIGPRTVARIRHELFANNKPIAATLEDTVMAFRTDGGSLVPTLAIDTPRKVECPAGDKFSCPPCNYEIGGVTGWLCVPMGRDRAQSLEASSFYLLGTDIACDVSVRIDDKRTAIQVVNELATVLRSVEPDATPQLATKWLPPAHADDAGSGRGVTAKGKFVDGLTGARIEIGLPSGQDDGGAIAAFHAVQFGSLQHLLLLRGSKTAIDQNRGAIDELIATFRLLDSDAERATAGARALQAHVGGVVVDNRYENNKHGASMQGPPGWAVQQRCGGALFRVLWTGPENSRIWLTGFAVPPGMDYWCQKTADHWVRKLCATTGIELPIEVEEWAADGLCDASVRNLACKAPRQNGAPGQAKRVLRVMFRDNLLLVADGTATTDPQWKLVKRSLGTMRL